MNLRTFAAPTFAQAMALVKTEMGSEAVILHTRTLQRRRWMGLRRREVVEITAGVGLNVQSRGLRKPAGIAQNRTKAVREIPREAAPREIPSQRGPTSAPGKELLETPVANRAMMQALSNQVTEVRGMLDDMVGRSKREAA